VYVVYNTPHPLPIERELRELAGRTHSPRRKLVVLEAVGSHSKAENLNLVLESVADPYVALYDADHRPDPRSLSMMMQEMLRYRCEAVQGSTYIRDLEGSALGSLVNAEFFVTHFIYFPAMQQLSGTGYFGGSNALWRTETLRRYGFDSAMHCEDVDVSARAILDGYRIRFLPTARSGELAPAGTSALAKQRLRWFVGWEQVTHKYYRKVFASGLTIPRKVGFCYLFHLRWVLLFAALMGAVVNPIITSPFVYPLPTWSISIQCCVYTAVALYVFVAGLGLCFVLQHEPRNPLGWLWVVVFFVLGWLYVGLHFTLQTVAFVKVVSGNLGEWTVTERSSTGVERQASGVGAPGKPAVRGSSGGGSAALQSLQEPLLSPP